MIMTSEPDGRGQQFIAAMCEKVSQGREHFPAAECWADGGITLRAARLLAAAGAASGDWPGVIHDGEL